MDGKAALRRRMISIVEDVKRLGAFKPRVPEGKAGLGADGDAVAVKPDGRPRYAVWLFVCHCYSQNLFSNPVERNPTQYFV